MPALVLTMLLRVSAFTDDFESGQLLTVDGGQWSSATFFPNISLVASPLAAHRGGLGFALIDTDARITGPAVEGFLVRRVAGPGDALYLRYWVRQGFRGTGSIELDFVSTSPDAGNEGSGTVFDLATGRLRIGGVDSSGTLTSLPADAGLRFDTWHLLELGTVGLGTTDGGRRLWVDGALAVAHDGADFRGLESVFVSVGENTANPTSTTGTLYFDDVSASSQRAPSRVAAVTPRAALAGACTPFELRLTDTDGVPSRALYDLAVRVVATPARVFGGPECESESSDVVVPAGADRAWGGLISDEAGVVHVLPLSVDLLQGSAAELDVRGPLTVGCGCGESAGLGAAYLLVLVLLRRRGSWSMRVRR